MSIPCRLPNGRPVRVAVHSGSFHSDELLALSVLSLFFRKRGISFSYVRTRDANEIKKADIVCDVGGILDPEAGRFDHHQREGAGAHDGIPYSSFGLVWKYFGLELVDGDELVWRTIERKIALPVDANDNGVLLYNPVRKQIYPLMFHDLVSAFHLTWKEKESGEHTDDRFDELLVLVTRYLEREIIVARDNAIGARLVHQVYHESKDKRVIVLDRDLPWEEELSKHIEPIYVVSPRYSSETKMMWRLECVRSDVNTFDCRRALPSAWRGLMNDELAGETGVPGATFCHRKGFLAIAKTKEDALKLAHLAL